MFAEPEPVLRNMEIKGIKQRKYWNIDNLLHSGEEMKLNSHGDEDFYRI